MQLGHIVCQLFITLTICPWPSAQTDLILTEV